PLPMPYHVKALAVDTLGAPEAYATCRLFAMPDTIRPVRGFLTDDNGVVCDSLPRAGEYRLVITGMTSRPLVRNFSLTDDAPLADLGTLVLLPAPTELAAVTVTAAKPLATRQIDRYVYDVKSDPLAPSEYIADVLRRVPMVSVDPDGTVKLNGQTGFKIYKNGRPNHNFSNNAKDIFRALPASTIKRVEVITDPGAREDAEGTGMILNIVTDSDIAIKGVLGTVSMSSSSNRPIPAPGVNVLTQIGKVTLSLAGGGSVRTRYHSDSSSSSMGEYVQTGTRTEESSVSRGSGSNAYMAFEASYEPSAKDLITAEVSVSSGRNKSEQSAMMQYFDSDGVLTSRYATESATPHSTSMYVDGAVNYQRSTARRGETITLSYHIGATRNNSRSEQTYSELFLPPMAYTGINADSRRRFTEHTAQLDWTRPYGKVHVLDLGAKLIYRDNSSTGTREYVGVNTTFDDFSHMMTIGAAYADYRAMVGKFSFRAGLRYEFSRLTAKYRTGDRRKFGSDLNDFAPNVSIAYRPDDRNMLVLSYVRSISRPGINYLDPTVAEGPLLTTSGNPSLQSASTNNLRLNYSLIKQKYNIGASVGYSFSDDGISIVKWVEGEHVYASYGNVNRVRTLSFNAYGRVTLGPKTSVSFNGAASYNCYDYPAVALSNKSWTGMVYCYATQRLPWKLDLSGTVSWMSGWANVYYTSPSSIYGLSHSISLQRMFLKENRLAVALTFSNPFGPATNKSVSHSINSDYIATATGYRRYQRAASLRISYRFGKLNARVRKTAANIHNDDMVGQKE
ncbi:MAG: TonB-dependent receptor, partial [Muribaculaceae bacterium]|nr:TonB-dependent receptor [Muribaculaceae bacterium]